MPFILVQRDLKRLLAYSSVEHIGLIAVAVGLGGPLALYAGLLHLRQPRVTKPLLFFALATGAALRHARMRGDPRRGAGDAGELVRCCCSAASRSPGCRRPASS